MANQDIINYIKEASKYGDSPKKIKSDLLAAGWKEPDVENAFGETPPKAPKKHVLKVLLTLLFILILAVGLFIGAGGLSYLGILSPTKTLSEKCTIGPGLVCSQFDVTSTSISLVIENQIGSDIQLIRIKAPTCEKEFNAPINAGGVGAFTLVGCSNGQADSMFSGDIVITYSAGGLPHDIPGQLIAIVKG